MSLWQQLHQLLSEAPGNVVYHLVTLFALQATLALALAQWRRTRTQTPDEPVDSLARRLVVAAGALLLARFLLLVISLLLAAQGDRLLAVGVLPPLEQAINTVTALLLVWALVPRPSVLPRLPSAVTLLLLLLIGVMYAFFAQDWVASADAGLTYNASPQSTAWGVFQLVILGVGSLVLLFSRRPGWALFLAPILILFLTHLVQFWDYPERIPGNTEIPVWIRLGHLFALPLLAVIAYRNTLSHLLATRTETGPGWEQVADTLQLATAVVDTRTLDQTLAAAARMIAGISEARFIGLAVRESERPDYLQVRTLQPGVGAEPQSWGLNVDDWPAFRLAMEQNRDIELLPAGMGARQLHDLAQELGWQMPAPLLIVPLQAGDNVLGVLLLGGVATGGTGSPSLRSLVHRLAAYVAHVLFNVRLHEERGIELPPVPALSPEPVSGRLIALEEERDRALAEVETMEGRLQQMELRLTETRQQARDLAATVEALEQMQPDAERAALEAEVSALRESLIDAEEAMAIAAAGEAELSTDWVTLTISRYSGELEEAQTRIGELEEALARRDPAETGELLTALAQELRTPLTSIAGYTDILLGETMGILGSKQREFLQRVKANVERMGLLLEQIVQLAAADQQPARLSDIEQIALSDVVETAVNTVITQVRKKGLRLNLDIAEGIPQIQGNREALSQVLIHLLNNAFQVSDTHGDVTISAHTDTMEALGPEGEHRSERFIHLAVRDTGGGIRPEDRSHVFDPQYRADNPLIAGLGDTGAGLAVAQTLVDAHGGRIWVESEVGVGSTFTVLLPLGANGNGALPPNEAAPTPAAAPGSSG